MPNPPYPVPTAKAHAPLIDDEERAIRQYAVEEMFRVHAEIGHRLDDCCLPLLDQFTNGELDVDELHAAMMRLYYH
ncbi:MAG TPA: hypothetical protein VGE64_02155 [Xanthomonadaceae bacterium]|jgi:hypothetical protein|uniref:Uncharacterized protein n=1 Tax=Lysobacter hankyongensis TaxID=1176535 RepID=A0ABP9BI59_9GAMM